MQFQQIDEPSALLSKDSQGEQMRQALAKMEDPCYAFGSID